MKRFLAFILAIITIILGGCSKESKFGVEQFVERMNTSFETEFATNEFTLGKSGDNTILFRKEKGQMITLSLDTNSKIKGVAIVLTADESIENGIDIYCKICSVFTGNDFDTQQKALNECKITAENINFTDSNMVITVGRYKYTVVCNDYSITLFCDKV